MRKATAAVALGMIVIGVGIWAVWGPEVALSQSQPSASDPMAGNADNSSCAGMMEHMMQGMMGGMHGMTNMGNMAGMQNDGPGGPSMSQGTAMGMPVVGLAMPNMIGMAPMMAPSSATIPAARRLTDLANKIDLLAQRMDQLAPALQAKTGEQPKP